MQSGFDPLFPRNALRAYWKSQYLDELSDGAIDALADLARKRPAPLTLVNVFHMGGAIAEVDPEATAFSERAAPFMVTGNAAASVIATSAISRSSGPGFTPRRSASSAASNRPTA